MNKNQKQVLQSQFNSEKIVLHNLQNKYKSALKDINNTIAQLKGRTDAENAQSIVYQLQYQEALKKQVNGILDKLDGEQYTSISEYLSGCYEDGFLGVMYDLHGQGIPLVLPIDQNQVVKAVQLDTKLSKPLYKQLGENIINLKYRITDSISRGIVTGSSYADMAREISRYMVGDYSKMKGGALGKAYTIARTEGHRIQNEAANDARTKAKEKGADIVKQWDGTLDARTRPSHRIVDGEIRELDEPFSNGLMFPGDPAGKAAEVINCRCACLQRAKWALDEDELETLKKRAEYFGLDKSNSFEYFKTKYIDALPKAPPITKPFENKVYTMNPDGTLSEGKNDFQDSFELDFTSDKVITKEQAAKLSQDELAKYDVIIDGDKITVLDNSKLKTLQKGTKWNELTYTLNDDGTYSIGAVKYQAQYKIDLQGHKVLNVDVTKAIDANPDIFDDFPDVAKTQVLEDSLSAELKAKVDSMYNAFGGAAKYDDVMYQVLKNEGYDAVHIINTNTATTDKLDDILQLFDDSKATKTKKSKLETLGESLAKTQKKLGKIDNKTYSGIWYNQDVQVSDYSAYKSKIQAKKDYFIDQLKIETDPSKIAKYQKYLDDLDEFEKLGSEYEDIQIKINKIKKDIQKFTPKSVSSNTSSIFSDDAFDAARKNAARNFSSRSTADQFHRPYLDSKWDELSDKEKYSVWEYTQNSNPMNKPLSGYDETWRRSDFKGVGNAHWNHEDKYRSFSTATFEKKFGKDGHKQYFEAIKDLTKAIDKFELPDDVYLVRGSDSNGLAGLLEGDILSFDDAKHLLDSGDISTLKQITEGQSFKFHSFMSTGISSDAGFGGNVKYKIYAPKGTHGVYAEPQSYYGNTISGEHLYKTGAQYYSVGGEAEVILQRGTEYRITDITKSGYNDYTVEMEVANQPNYFQYGDEETFNDGATRHID